MQLSYILFEPSILNGQVAYQFILVVTGHIESAILHK